MGFKPESAQVLWLTQRSERHQQAAMAAAPQNVTVIMLRDPDQATLQAAIAQADFLISERSGVIDAALLQHAPDLKLIVRLGSLIHDIDLEACRQRGIAVSRQPIPGAIQVAEHILMVTLALLQNFKVAQQVIFTPSEIAPARTDENTFRYNWQKLSGVTGLSGKKIGILGMGEIGVEVARRLHGFAPEKLYYHKRTRYPENVETELHIEYIDSIHQYVDILINLLPYSAETDHFLNAKLFSEMPPGSLLIHAGSGSTIDEQALVAALQNVHLAGAALDTYEYEPLPLTHPLIEMARDPHYNVILTPHIAAGTTPLNRAEDYAEVIRFMQDEPLKWGI